MKRKVCIVANYNTTVNFGALLQAFALNRVVNDMGFEAKTLYLVGDSATRKKKLIRQLRGLQIQNLLRETRFCLLKLFVSKNVKRRKKVMDEFRFAIPHTDKYLRSQLHLLQDQYDVFICGSDQIFRPRRDTHELVDYYWLSMINNGAVKASYAASMGIDSYEDALIEPVRNYLADFDFISIREKSAADYLAELTGRTDIITSVDPVFLRDINFWKDFAKPYDIGEEYILVYMIHGTERLLKSIRSLAGRLGLKIVTFPFMTSVYRLREVNFGDIRIYDASPQQFLYLLQNAKYVFTDSFHGTALSLILHLDHVFVSRANRIAFSRISNILELLEVTDIAIPECGLNPEDYLKERVIDWDRIDRIIEQKRKESYEYLQRVILCQK